MGTLTDRSEQTIDRPLLRGMTVRRLFVALFLVALATMAVRPTLDPDLWWHLRTGEAVLRDGIPRQDIFSFTVPDHPWVTHEWLSDVLLWGGYSLAGLPGLILLFAALTTLTYWLVYRRCAGRPYLAAFLVLLAAFASAPFWGVRPQLFNMLFTAAFVYLMEGYRKREFGRRVLWLLPLLTLVWANLHSGYLLGVVLLATYVAGEALRLTWRGGARRGLDRAEIGWLALMTGLSFVAAVANPNGPELWIYPFFTLGSNAMQRYILEWQSPDFHQAIFWPFALLLFTGVAAFVAARKRPTITDALLFGGTAAAGLLSARHIPIFAIVATPIISRFLLGALENTRLGPVLRGQGDDVAPARAALLNWALLILLAALAAVWIAGKVQGNDAAIAEKFPVAAVDFLEGSDLAAQRGYNSYNWGGYLIWRGLPVFVDGRADVYGDDFLHDYRLTFDVTGRWREPLDAYDVDYVLIEQGSPLDTLLATTPDWSQVYRDELASVFVRAD